MMPMQYTHGNQGLSITKDTDKAAKLLLRAAELGSADASDILGAMYYNGIGVNEDKTKAIQYLEKAAMGGNANARFNLSKMEFNAGSFDRAIKHWLIAASFGYIMAVNEIQKAMVEGNATRDHYAKALRGYQQYVNEVRSDDRDAAVAFDDKYKYY
jgi:TPR repeat protein